MDSAWRRGYIDEESACSGGMPKQRNFRPFHGLQFVVVSAGVLFRARVSTRWVSSSVLFAPPGCVP